LDYLHVGSFDSLDTGQYMQDSNNILMDHSSNIIYSWYSWNIAEVDIKHQSINQTLSLIQITCHIQNE
jgi:hypothetical protein